GALKLLALGGQVAGGNLVPVDDVPPCGDVVRPAVLVLEVVGVLPHVEAQDGRVAVHDGRVLVGRAGHRELAVFGDDEPGPAAAKASGCGLGKGLLKRVKAAKGLVDGCRQVAAGRVGAAGLHDLPKERVVGVAPAV